MISLFLCSFAIMFGITVVGDMFNKRNRGTQNRSTYRSKYYRY